jgi:hypothetical protein
MKTSRLKISGQAVPGLDEGTWFVPVRAGQHEVKVTDPFGVAVIKTSVAVHPGASHVLSFQFGAWRYRVLLLLFLGCIGLAVASS